MQVYINSFISFICGLVIAAAIYAEPIDTNSQKVASHIDAVAAIPQGKISSETVVADGLVNKITVQEMNINAPKQPQLDQVKPALEKQQLLVPQEGVNAIGMSEEVVDPNAINVLDRLKTLEAQSGKIQAQIAQINERVNVLEERLIIGGPVEQKVQNGVYSKIGQRIDQLKDRIGNKLFLLLAFGVIVILLLFLGYIIFPRREAESFPGSYTHETLPPKEAEFNPMEGQEGVAAKLNLARSYVEMGKENQAQKVLLDVLACGNESEQEEAKKLLEDIKHPDLDR